MQTPVDTEFEPQADIFTLLAYNSTAGERLKTAMYMCDGLATVMYVYVKVLYLRTAAQNHAHIHLLYLHSRSYNLGVTHLKHKRPQQQTYLPRHLRLFDTAGSRGPDA